MNTLKLTKKDFDAQGKYIGKTDVSDYQGNIEIDENLGWVSFVKLVAIGYIYAEAGSGIKAGEGIKAGWGIEAGWGIKAGSGIEAGWGIEAGSGIKAGWGIKAGEGIKAGWGIKAELGIKAGWGIEAGEGIVSGLFITCKLSLQFSTRIFAGICWWRKLQNDEEKTITCGKLIGGEVCYGIVKELGMPDDKPKSLVGKIVEVKINDKQYKAKIIED